jgi:sulfonate transport system substrate-binding protein
LFATALSFNAAAATPEEVRLDYAYYSPTSLVLKHFGWLEESLKPSGVKVKWTLSQGSNRALEYLSANSIDFGSTAGLAAVLSRANGNPIKNVYVFSRPEWTAMVVAKDSPIKTVADLKGKKIAATKGTDPYLFLLRTLKLHNIKKSDVEIVHLQHADGRAALETGRVDAWAGLDPHMAASELQANSRLLYRNVGFNTYGFLNVTEDFAKKYPEQVKQVIAAYERARLWILANPKEASQIQADEAKISLAVAKVQLNRTDFSNPYIGREHRDALQAAAPILLQEDLVKKGTDVNKVINDLIDPSFVQSPPKKMTN